MRIYGYIYLIRNRVNGKVYVGQTTGSVGRRWTQHQWFARKGKRGVLFSAIRKYGPESFDVVTLHQASSREELDEMEIGAVWSHDSTNPEIGYNVAAGGNGSSGLDHFLHGVPLTPEHIAHLKEAFKHRPAPTKEHRQKIGRASRGRTHAVSPEARKRMSERRKGKYMGADNPFFGRTHTAETLAKMSGPRVIPRTGFYGVTYEPSPGRSKPYRVRIRVDGVSRRFGNYSSAEEAAIAYNVKATELFGDGAVLNVVQLLKAA